ncbi:MAG: hypothetical protein N2376_05505, partial [Clostridia bacterium]|nr:hypothetical protein [Clostridia bacterium]
EQGSIEIALDDETVGCDASVGGANAANLQMKASWLKTKRGAGALGLLASLVVAGMSLPLSLACGAVSALFLYSSIKGTGKVAEYSRNQVLSINRLDFVKRLSMVLLNSLKESCLISRNLMDRQVCVSSQDGKAIRVFLDATPEESQLFSRCLDELMSPLMDQRYAIPRYESNRDQKGSWDVIKAGLDPASAAIAAYHPVPDVLGANKEKAAIFQKYWNQLISRGEIIFLKSAEGEKILERYGMNNSLGINKHVANFWR